MDNDINSLPNKSKFKNGLADKYSIEQMRGKEGLNLVKRFLDKELGEKELYKTISKWEILEDCQRCQGEDIRIFVDRFDMAYKAEVNVCGVRLPSEVRAFMLLGRARVDDKVSRSLILSKLNYNEGDTLYEPMESQILEVLGGGPGMQMESQGLLAVEVIPMQGERCYVIQNGGRCKKEKRRQGRPTEGQGW